MYIGNVGIFVKDLKGARRFFESYFGAKLLKSYNEPENNYYSDILELDHGAWLELMTKPEIVDEPKELNRSGLAHVCFKADTRQQLDDIVAHFKKDGYKIQYEPSNPEGAGEVRAVTLEDIVVEVNYTPAAKAPATTIAVCRTPPASSWKRPLLRWKAAQTPWPLPPAWRQFWP